MSKAEEDRHARFLRDTILPDLAYASRRLPEISDTLENADHAMEWGYGHEAGPFRIWDLLGVKETVEQMESLDIQVADWVKEMLDGGNESFYKKEGTSELRSARSRWSTSRCARTRCSSRSIPCARRTRSSPATTRRASWT